MGDCNCGKPKPGPLGGGQKPGAASLVASAGSSITHVSPSGTRKTMGDAVAAAATIAREGGSLEFG